MKGFITRYLEGQFGAQSAVNLVNNLCIEAASVVHVTHQNWECLANRTDVLNKI